MYQEFIVQILETVLIPLLIAGTGFLIKWLNVKAEEIKINTDNAIAQKYVDMLKQTVEDCVKATSQTYVEALKKENAFTKDAQQVAFQMSYEAIMNVLSEDALEYLTEVYGDLNIYVAQLIEAEVKKTK